MSIENSTKGGLDTKIGSFILQKEGEPWQVIVKRNGLNYYYTPKQIFAHLYTSIANRG